MAKPIKLKKEEAEVELYECQCGVAQTSELTRCPECSIPLCDTCMPFGFGVACVDCADPDDVAEYDETDF